MPVNLSPPTTLLPVNGVELATVAAGIRYQERDDLVLITLCEGTRVAAVFTQNKCCAAPVIVAKQHLAQAEARALLINSGNANAVTGEQGLSDAMLSCERVASSLEIKANQVLPFSTGVIGEPLNMAALLSGVNYAVPRLAADEWLSAASGIMTTDTVPKGISVVIQINGQDVTITGISKGSGMICPNMATMLAYVVTDADIAQDDLESLLSDATQKSFNRITVDSDTSTNDALVLAATGRSAAGLLSSEEELDSFSSALEEVLVHLATAIIRDGEGATKFVNIEVLSGLKEEDCRTIAYDIAHSPLVKTALYASDPNWGRILMALGKSSVDSLEMAKVDIVINGVALIEHGQPASSYSEEAGQAVFQQEEITISINLNPGASCFNVWTSDLSHDYVSINADYRS